MADGLEDLLDGAGGPFVDKDADYQDVYLIALAQQLAYLLRSLKDGMEGRALGSLNGLVKVGNDIDFVHAGNGANDHMDVLDVPQHASGDSLATRHWGLTLLGDGNLESGAFHDAGVGIVVVFLVERGDEGIGLVEDGDGFIVEAARRTDKGGPVCGWSWGPRWVLSKGGRVELEGEAVDAVTDLAGEDGEGSWGEM